MRVAGDKPAVGGDGSAFIVLDRSQ
jgi:hypothetical protein